MDFVVTSNRIQLMRAAMIVDILNDCTCSCKGLLDIDTAKNLLKVDGRAAQDIEIQPRIRTTRSRNMGTTSSQFVNRTLF